MTAAGHPLRRADQLLTELVELVETARAVPMSSSCVVPREHVLDLLDELRDVMPAEMDEARRVVDQRDAVVAEADLKAARTMELARHQAAQLVDDARQRTEHLVEAARAEQAELVSNTDVHQSATAAAAKLHADAEQAARDLQADAEQAAAQLQGDAERYAEQTLADLLAVLQRAVTTTEQGRAALTRRRPADVGERPISGPAPD